MSWIYGVRDETYLQTLHGLSTSPPYGNMKEPIFLSDHGLSHLSHLQSPICYSGGSVLMKTAQDAFDTRPRVFCGDRALLVRGYVC